MTPRQAQRTLKKMGDKLSYGVGDAVAIETALHSSKPHSPERHRYELHDGREVEVWVGKRAGVECLNVRALGGMGLILLPDSAEQVGLLIGRK